jgi:hypothetical protein
MSLQLDIFFFQLPKDSEMFFFGDELSAMSHQLFSVHFQLLAFSFQHFTLIIFAVSRQL